MVLWVVAQFWPLYSVVVLSGAVLQAKRRISRFSGLARSLNKTTNPFALEPAYLL
jgi:hypothetical protein